MPARDMIQRGSQSPVIVVFQRHEPEGLQNSSADFSRGAEKFSHTMNWTRLCLEGHFDEVALAKRTGKLKQAAGDGNGLEFGFSAAAVFHANRSWKSISKLDPGGPP